MDGWAEPSATRVIAHGYFSGRRVGTPETRSARRSGERAVPSGSPWFTPLWPGPKHDGTVLLAQDERLVRTLAIRLRTV